MGGKSYMDKMNEDEAVQKEQARKASEAEKLASDDARYKQLKATAKTDREADMAEGRARGETEFSDGSLGRVDDARSADISDLIAKRKENLSGYTEEEMNAQRDQMNEATRRATQTGLRAVRGDQGKSGVRGGLASAQAVGVVNNANTARAATERDLYVNQIAQRRSALDNLEKSVSSAEATELAKKEFNIGQANKEKYGRLGTEFGYASLGSAESSAVMQRVVGERASADANKIAEESGKK